VKVDYINHEVHDDFVRCTFIGSDSSGRRRPVVDLDATDLRNLIVMAKEFRQRQRHLVRTRQMRIDDLTSNGLAE
jgi:hypothetical protein